MASAMEAHSKHIDPHSTGPLRIGDWVVFPDLNQLVRGADEVRIEPKAMAVLLYLADRPGEVARREDLLEAVWPGVIVGDNALTQAVIKLRKALGDTARKPAYIEAISKRGYRLIARVTLPGGEMPGMVTDQGARQSARPRRALRWSIATLVLVLAGSAAWLMQWTDETTEAPSPAATPPYPALALAQPTIVVRPFEPVGSDEQQRLIAQGITADLVTDLAKVPSIWVATGPASDEPPSAAGNSAPRYVLSGTVQRDGTRLRLHVHLSDAVADRQLWSERFDRDVKDLFSVQDDLVRSILSVLPIKLSEAETARLAKRYTRNLDAYELFLRGQAALLVRRRAQNEAARELYWKAIYADPAFARAYAGLAMTYGLEYQLGWANDGKATLARALEFAQTGVEMSPDLPEAHWALGFVHLQALRHDEALRHVERALQLNPSYADAYALQAGIQILSGRPGESIAPMRSAMRLNPSAGWLYFMQIGRAYYFLGDSEQARVNLEHAVQRNPESLESRIYLAATYWLAGDRSAAEWQAQEIRVLEPRFEVNTWLATYPMTDAGQKQRLVKALSEIGL